MTSTLDALTNFAIKPSAPFSAGIILFGVVWGFFKGVESVLSDDTKLEIALWLLGVKVGQKLEPWPETFARVFDRVFGKKHLTWKCFLRSICASLFCGMVAGLFTALRWQQVSVPNRLDAFRLMTVLFLPDWFQEFLRTTINFVLNMLSVHASDSIVPMIPVAFQALLVVTSLFLTNCVPDYMSLLETRFILRIMRRCRTTALFFLLLCDSLFTLATPVLWDSMLFCLPRWGKGFWGMALQFISPRPAMSLGYGVRHWSVYPALLSSVWLWLYAGSGFILKAARRFDIGFDWFNRKFDIEHKPLQSIGLVAGAIVAVCYWSVALVSRVL